VGRHPTLSLHSVADPSLLYPLSSRNLDSPPTSPRSLASMPMLIPSCRAW